MQKSVKLLKRLICQLNQTNAYSINDISVFWGQQFVVFFFLSIQLTFEKRSYSYLFYWKHD